MRHFCLFKLGEWCSIGVVVFAFVASVFAVACLNKAHAAEPWSTTDKVLGTATGLAILADWAQTRQIAKNPDKWRETNELLGEHPSVGDVNRHFLIYGATVGILAHISPPPIRKALLGGVLVYQIDLVSENYSLGIEVKW